MPETQQFPQSQVVKYFQEQYVSPNILILASCAIILILLSVLGKQKKGKVGRGQFASAKELKNACKLAQQQIEAGKHNEVAFWIREPSKAGMRSDSKGNQFYYCPCDPKTLWFPDAQRGTAVIGGPGSGKSFGAVEPIARSAFAQGFPTILYDFKYPGQTLKLAGYAKQMGYEVSIFAPGFPESCVCNPLDFLSSEEDAETARQMSEVLNANFKRLTGTSSGGGDNPFFENAGIQLTEAILLLTKASRYPDIMMATCLLQLDSLIERISGKSELNYWIRTSFGQLTATANSPETVASIISTAFINFNRFMKPGLLKAFCGQTNLPLDLQGKKLVIFGMDRNRRDVVAPLVATILHLLVERNLAKKRRDPLVLLLDEVATFYLPRLGNWLNESREDGLARVLAFQSLAQLEKMYDKSGSRIILTGCSTKLVFNPVELQAAEEFSKILGDEDIVLKQKSRGHSGGKGSSNVADRDQQRRLFDVNQFLTLPQGSCIAINPGVGHWCSLIISIKALLGNA